MRKEFAQDKQPLSKMDGGSEWAIGTKTSAPQRTESGTIQNRNIPKMKSRNPF